MDFVKGSIIDYKGNFYRAKCEVGNSCKPDDLPSKAIFEIFTNASRSFMILHIISGLSIIIFIIYAL